MTLKIAKNPHCFNEDHNKFMVTAICNYPGVEWLSESDNTFEVSATPDAQAFIEHLYSCDLIVIL